MADIPSTAVAVVGSTSRSSCGASAARAHQPLGQSRDWPKRRVRSRALQVSRNAGAVSELGQESQRGRIGKSHFYFILNHHSAFACTLISLHVVKKVRSQRANKHSIYAWFGASRCRRLRRKP